MATPRVGQMPDKTTVERVCGLRVTFRYYFDLADVTVEPDADDVARAEAVDLVRCWQAIGDWAARFRQANAGWTVGGEAPEEDWPE